MAPKRKTGGRAPSKASQLKRKPSSETGSSPLSPVRSVNQSPAHPTFASRSGTLGPSEGHTGSNGTPNGVIDEAALQDMTGEIEDDVEMQLLLGAEPVDALPEIGAGDEGMDIDIDAAMADQLMAQLEADPSGGYSVAGVVSQAGEDEEEDEDEDDEEDEEEDGDEDEDDTITAGPSTLPSASLFRYPTPPSNFLTLSEREKSFKSARFLACQSANCDCQEMLPPAGAQLGAMSRAELEEILDRDEEDEGDEERTGEGWWRVCGQCGHGWDEEGAGHTWPAGVSLEERNRRGKVVGRIEELLNVSRTTSPRRAMYLSLITSG